MQIRADMDCVLSDDRRLEKAQWTAEWEVLNGETVEVWEKGCYAGAILSLRI